MALFSRILVIESPLPPDQAWRSLLAIVKNEMPICTNCGQTFLRPGIAACLCPRCGAVQPPATPPLQSLFQRVLLFGSSEGFEFEGVVSPQGFKISRIINYRNNAVPTIAGRFEPFGSGTRIVLDIRMPGTGYVLLAGGTIIPFIIGSVLAGDAETASKTGLFLVPLCCMPIFFFLMCWFLFRYEANIAAKAFERIWNAAPRSEP